MDIICKISLIFFFLFMFELIILLIGLMINKVVDDIYYELSIPKLRKIENVLDAMEKVYKNVKFYSILAMKITFYCLVILVFISFIAIMLLAIKTLFLE